MDDLLGKTSMVPCSGIGDQERDHSKDRKRGSDVKGFEGSCTCCTLTFEALQRRLDKIPLN